MNDPWESVRSFPCRELQWLLTDADALLDIVKVIDGCAFASNTVELDVYEIVKAVATLPKHLRGGNNG